MPIEGPWHSIGLNYVVNTTSASTLAYTTFTNSVAQPLVPAKPREETPLEWLDRQIEATCKLGRL